MTNAKFYSPGQLKLSIKPNGWDMLAVVVVLALIMVLASATKQFSAPFHLGDPVIIHLKASALPGYALQTVLRMAVALLCSLLFTFVFATWAARSKRAEKLIIPVIDMLQSVPVLAFLSLTIVAFIKCFPNSLLGPECASIFLIFTAQAWNMALSFYQSLKSVPKDLIEAVNLLGLSSWQRFWRLDVPFAIPSLLWNMMMSMSASWFSLVASEAVSVAGQTVALPGIGSYISTAIAQANLLAIMYAILAMFAVIVLYDQLLFKPLVQWSEKFKMEQMASERSSQSWLMNLWLRTRLLRLLGTWFGAQCDKIINFRWSRAGVYRDTRRWSSLDKQLDMVWYGFLSLLFLAAATALGHFIKTHVSWLEVGQVLVLGLYTGARVVAMIVICTLVWVPLGVWIGLRPHVAAIVQPVAQFLAAFPANLLFPLVVVVIVKWHLNVNVWTTPLMILGTQWYILFNVIAGAAALPKDLKQVTENFGVKGWLWWRKLILPGIFPYYITGAITAVGGAWNASLLAEVVSWGNTTLVAKGLGAYITRYTGDFVHTVLGVSVMCLFVFALNHLVWRPLYAVAVNRFQLS